MQEIFIPGNVPSSKNGKQWTGKSLIHSKAAQKYYKSTDSYWKKYAEMFREMVKDLPKPLNIEFTFIRGSRRKFIILTHYKL